MNKIYKTMYDAARGCCVVASELAKRKAIAVAVSSALMVPSLAVADNQEVTTTGQRVTVNVSETEGSNTDYVIDYSGTGGTVLTSEFFFDTEYSTIANTTVTMKGPSNISKIDLNFWNQGPADELIIDNFEVRVEIPGQLSGISDAISIRDFDSVTLKNFVVDEGKTPNVGRINVHNATKLNLDGLTFQNDEGNPGSGGILSAYISNPGTADHGFATIKNVAIEGPRSDDHYYTVSLWGNFGGDYDGDSWTLTDEITFKEGSQDINFSLGVLYAFFVAEHNIVDETFTGNLDLSYFLSGIGNRYYDATNPEDVKTVFDQVKALPIFEWNPDQSRLNAQSVTLDGSDGSFMSMSSLSIESDNWLEYKGALNVENMMYLTLTHAEGENRFATHWFNKDTVLQVPLYNPGYNMTELEDYLFSTHTLYELASSEIQHKIVAIQDGGSGALKATNIYYATGSDRDSIWLENEDGYFLVYQEVPWGDTVSQAQSEIFKDSRSLVNSEGTVLANLNTESYYKLDDDRKSLSGYLRIVSVEALKDQYFVLSGEVGSTDQYLAFRDGIYGEGGLLVTTDQNGLGSLFLGGKNTYSGATVVDSNATLHLESADAVSGSNTLVLNGNATLDFTGDLTNFTQVFFMGGESTSRDLGHTVIGNADDTTSRSITVAGADAHLSFFQGEKNTEPDTTSAVTLATNADTSGSLPHHVVDVYNTDINIVGGAALWINHLNTLTTDANSQEMAVLRLQSGSNLNISGSTGEGDSSATSSHVYIGNGIIQVQDGASLTLGEDSAIHFSPHLSGFFEYGGSSEDPHHHATIEVASGGTVNFELGRHNHIYGDAILAEGHEHYLLATDYESRLNGQTGYYYDAGNTITFSINEEAANHIKETVASGNYDTTYVTEAKIATLKKFAEAAQAAGVNWSEKQELSALQSSLEGQGLTEAEFNEALGTLVTLGMDNAHHDAWQKYAIVSDTDGVYMTVTATNNWSDVSDVWLSLQNATNEAIQLTAKSQQGDLAQTSGAYNIIMNAVNNFTMGEGAGFTPDFVAAARMIDASGQLATVAGAQTVAFDMLQNRRDSLMRHMGSVRLPENETKLWVDVLGMQNKSFDMWNDLNGERQVKTRLSGIIMGADHQVTPDWLMGASFAYMNGTSETDLGIANQVNTDNDIDSYAFSLYSRYELNDRSRIKADLGVQRASNDITMLMPAQSLITDALKADVDTTAVQLNARYEYSFPVTENVVLTPFAGVQLTYLQTEGYTSMLGALPAWHTDKAEQYIYSVPVGVTLDAKLVNKDAVIRPQVSVYVQPNFGDTDVENVVTGYGLSSVDRVTPEVIGDWSYGAAVGATFEFTDRFHFSVDYNFHGSNESRNNSLKASMQYAF